MERKQGVATGSQFNGTNPSAGLGNTQSGYQTQTSGLPGQNTSGLEHTGQGSQFGQTHGKTGAGISGQHTTTAGGTGNLIETPIYDTMAKGPHTTATANLLDSSVSGAGISGTEDARHHSKIHGGGAEEADRHHRLGNDAAIGGAGAGVGGAALAGQ